MKYLSRFSRVSGERLAKGGRANSTNQAHVPCLSANSEASSPPAPRASLPAAIASPSSPPPAL